MTENPDRADTVQTPPVPDSMLSAVAVLDSLIRAGMRHVVVSPGSRSAPLAYAVAAAEEAGALIAHVRVDERVAAFTALGIAKASRLPVGLVCTSGTALGEYLPAVMEAYHAGVPLAIMSADRPVRLRGTGANQTTVQTDFFSPFVRASADLTSYPEHNPGQQTADFMACLAALTGSDAQDWSRTSDKPVGPAHINVCFDAPLTPSARTAEILPTWAASLAEHIAPGAASYPVELEPARLSPVEKFWLMQHEQAAQASPLKPEGAPDCPKTVVIAGDGAEPFAAEFARALNLPLLAEPSSQARHGATSIPQYTTVLGEHAASELGQSIERTILCGHPTLSRPISALLARTDVQHAYYAPRRASWYEPGTRAVREIDSPAELEAFALMGSGMRADDTWLDAWVTAGRRAQEASLTSIEAYRCAESETVQPQASIPFEECHQDGAHTSQPARIPAQALALQTWNTCAQQRRTLVVGSSSIVRDLDIIAPALGADAPARVLANRGLSGIDGLIATAVGVSLAGYYPTGNARTAADDSAHVAGAPIPVTLICGDLTFQYDISALNLPMTELLPDLDVVVYDDAGGGIFTALEHGALAQNPQFTRAVERFFTVQAAPNTDLERMAAGFGEESGIRVRIHRPNDIFDAQA